VEYYDPEMVTAYQTAKAQALTDLEKGRQAALARAADSPEGRVVEALRARLRRIRENMQTAVMAGHRAHEHWVQTLEDDGDPVGPMEEKRTTQSRIDHLEAQEAMFTSRLVEAEGELAAKVGEELRKWHEAALQIHAQAHEAARHNLAGAIARGALDVELHRHALTRLAQPDFTPPPAPEPEPEPEPAPTPVVASEEPPAEEQPAAEAAPEPEPTLDQLAAALGGREFPLPPITK
jgi:hypothetical protein